MTDFVSSPNIYIDYAGIALEQPTHLTRRTPCIALCWTPDLAVLTNNQRSDRGAGKIHNGADYERVKSANSRGINMLLCKITVSVGDVAEQSLVRAFKLISSSSCRLLRPN